MATTDPAPISIRDRRELLHDEEAAASANDRCELAAALTPIVTHFRRAHEMTIDVRIAPCLIAVPHAAFERAVTNLLENAATHAPGADVSITASVSLERCRMVIRDNGPGLPREVVDQLFDLDAATGRSEGGLGLWSTRYLIEQHGGTVELHPGARVNGAAAFVLDLPIASDRRGSEPRRIEQHRQTLR